MRESTSFWVLSFPCGGVGAWQSVHKDNASESVAESDWRRSKEREPAAAVVLVEYELEKSVTRDWRVESFVATRDHLLLKH